MLKALGVFLLMVNDVFLLMVNDVMTNGLRHCVMVETDRPLQWLCTSRPWRTERKERTLLGVRVLRGSGISERINSLLPDRIPCSCVL